MESQEAVEHVDKRLKEGMELEKVCREMYIEARDLWREYDEVVDDISCLVVKLDWGDDK